MDRRRLLGWLAFLGVAGLLALLPEFFPQEEAESLAVVPRGRPVPAAEGLAVAAPEARALRGGAASGAVPQADLFAARSWRAPPRRASDAAPPVAAAALPPPPAAAPPLPFEFIGRLDDSVRLRVFLLRGDRLHTVQAGDVIDGTYRVEKIAADELTFVYLPLKQTQSLSVGDHP